MREETTTEAAKMTDAQINNVSDDEMAILNAIACMGSAVNKINRKRKTTTYDICRRRELEMAISALRKIKTSISERKCA